MYSLYELVFVFVPNKKEIAFSNKPIQAKSFTKQLLHPISELQNIIFLDNSNLQQVCEIGQKKLESLEDTLHLSLLP